MSAQQLLKAQVAEVDKVAEALRTSTEKYLKAHRKFSAAQSETSISLERLATKEGNPLLRSMLHCYAETIRETEKHRITFVDHSQSTLATIMSAYPLKNKKLVGSQSATPEELADGLERKRKADIKLAVHTLFQSHIYHSSKSLENHTAAVQQLAKLDPSTAPASESAPAIHAASTRLPDDEDSDSDDVDGGVAELEARLAQQLPTSR